MNHSSAARYAIPKILCTERGSIFKVRGVSAVTVELAYVQRDKEYDCSSSKQLILHL